MIIAVSLLSGVIFGIGLTLGGMLDPSKVAGFLDLFGTWDPSLAFVMGGGVIVNAVGHYLITKRAKPVLADGFKIPTTNMIDRPLVIGAIVFGLGWGVSGLCPGPAVASMFLNPADGIGFIAFLIAGLTLGRTIARRL